MANKTFGPKATAEIFTPGLGLLYVQPMLRGQSLLPTPDLKVQQRLISSVSSGDYGTEPLSGNSSSRGNIRTPTENWNEYLPFCSVVTGPVCLVYHLKWNPTWVLVPYSSPGTPPFGWLDLGFYNHPSVP